MGEILFIAHRIPFPPDRGDKIRSHHVLKRLARIAPVHVACFSDDDLDQAEEFELASIARSYKLVRRAKPLLLAGIQALARHTPVSLAAFRDAALADYVGEVLRSAPISTIYVFSGQMGQYVPTDFAGRIVMDFVDVDSAKFDAYAANGKGPMRWVNAREARLLRDEEARLATRANSSLLITAAEAKLFLSRLTLEEREQAKVLVLGNGIDSEFFNPHLTVEEMRLSEIAGPRLIFTGQMDYAPNVEAVVRAAERIMPLVRQQIPDATFHVVGRNPDDAVLALHGRNGTHVWGRVDDIRPWIAAADLALVPLEIARGVQNKVLEAMAMARPVVLTSAAATGIDAIDGHHYTIAESDEDLAAAVVTWLSDPRKARIKGLAARRFVIDKASWQASLADLPEIVSAIGAPVRHAA